MRLHGDELGNCDLVYDFIGADEVCGHFSAPEGAGRRAVPLSLFTWVAERVTWTGTALLLTTTGSGARCLSSSTRILLPVQSRGVRVHARRSGEAPRPMLWRVDYRDDRDRVCARSSVLIAVVAVPEG